MQCANILSTPAALRATLLLGRGWAQAITTPERSKPHDQAIAQLQAQTLQSSAGAARASGLQ